MESSDIEKNELESGESGDQSFDSVDSSALSSSVHSPGFGNSSSSARSHRQTFATTSWSMISQAAEDDSPATKFALSTLCQNYWYPLYAFVRRKGYGSSDAEDLTQAFFAELLEKRKLAAADESRGKFRSFLLTSLDHFIKNQWRANQAIKRGGGQTFLSINFKTADERYANEPSHELTPEKIFERNWALAILNQSLQCVQEQYEQSNKGHLFDSLKIYLGEGVPVPYREVAEKLGMKEGAVKVAVHRIRERYGEQLRLQIARTIDDSRDVDSELKLLFDALR